MAIVPALPPQPVPIFSGFDYVTVDSARHRAYAAHTGSQSLLVVDTQSGTVVGQVKVGPLHGVAVDPATGHVYTGDGEAETVSEIDPVALTVVRSAEVGGAVDAIAYDPANGRIYADEDDGTHLYVVDAKAMKSVGTVDLPGHKPEYLAIDPATHEVYQNIANLAEIAVVDPKTLKVTRVLPTPEIVGNHPLQFDAALGHLLVGGQNGKIAAYDVHGKLLGSVAIQSRVDQCSFAPSRKLLACAGSGELTIVRDEPSGAPTLVARGPIAAGAHTVGFDDATGRVWAVWAEAKGDFVQAFANTP